MTVGQRTPFNLLINTEKKITKLVISDFTVGGRDEVRIHMSTFHHLHHASKDSGIWKPCWAISYAL